MIYYVYDGSFQGLLTAIYEAYYRETKPDDIVKADNPSANLFAELIDIKTDDNKADKVYQAAKGKISTWALRHVFYAYLSELDGVGNLIYRYLQLGFKVGKDIDRYLTDDRVLRIHQISRKVGAERHRLLGLIRFSKLNNGVYYASIEPDYNIVGLVAPHFAKRLSDQNWVIHDLKRGLAALYNQKEWVVSKLDSDKNFILSEEEQEYQNMWQGYFESVSIKERANPRQQRQFMPARYWKHLTEMNEK
ncbi:MAG: DNA metabolism protein [Firmicutes bacterium]|nr:DNA metabolism protein [Bacillota bacterium]